MDSNQQEVVMVIDEGSKWVQMIGSSILYIVIIATAILSVYYSYKSRRTTENIQRGLYAANMNLNMGILLIALALTQILLADADWVHATVGTVFLLIGLFNLFAGIRNRSIFKRHAADKEATPKP